MSATNGENLHDDFSWEEVPELLVVSDGRPEADYPECAFEHRPLEGELGDF